ncbi:MAG TPA: ATP-dependent protease subunit HslV [Armatimonadota bacterium]|nr:ATP-dependent protease subunit HslV [Armatimonadota bacterium]
MHGTTIVAVKRNGKVAVGGDGQVTLENTIMKQSAKKVRRIYQNKIVVGFAGSVADAQALTDKFETKLEETHGNLRRALIEFAKEWRTDRILRRLEALMIVADPQYLMVLSGNGEVIEPDEGVAAIGSGGGYALAAARALLKNTEMSARDIVEESLRVAASICIYTNDKLTIEEV